MPLAWPDMRGNNVFVQLFLCCKQVFFVESHGEKQIANVVAIVKKRLIQLLQKIFLFGHRNILIDKNRNNSEATPLKLAHFN